MITGYSEDCALTGVGLEQWNTGKVFLMSHHECSGDSESYSTNSYHPGAAVQEEYYAYLPQKKHSYAGDYVLRIVGLKQ